MAVPARKTSKAKKRKRRGNSKVAAPTLDFDVETGEFKRRHHISLKAYKQKLKEEH